MSKTAAAAPANLAYITPGVLTWVLRHSASTREDVATALDVPASVITAWETSESMPTFEQAIELAGYLGIPLGYLFLSTPPIRKLSIPDKRTLNQADPFSANFRELLSDTLVRQDWYRRHVIDNGGKALPFVGSASLSDDPLQVAASIRETLKLTPEDRRKTYSWTEYLGRLSDRAESAGILVMRSGVVGNSNRTIDRTEVQGFALIDVLAPVVYVNASDFVSARIFTLAHELAHIWVGQSAISNPNQGEPRVIDAAEIFCDRVATELLVPQKAFRVGWKQTPEAQRVDVLVRRYWVSARVVLRRARELNLISLEDYLTLREQAVAAETAKQKTGSPTYFVTAVARAGKRLTDAVLSEVASGATPIVEGASLLSMSANTFASFAEDQY